MKSKEAYRALLKAGWYEVRRKGSHVTLSHDHFDYSITFPYHGSKEIGKGLWIALKKKAGL